MQRPNYIRVIGKVSEVSKVKQPRQMSYALWVQQEIPGLYFFKKNILQWMEVSTVLPPSLRTETLIPQLLEALSQVLLWGLPSGQDSNCRHIFAHSSPVAVTGQQGVSVPGLLVSKWDNSERLVNRPDPRSPPGLRSNFLPAAPGGTVFAGGRQINKLYQTVVLHFH